jgi:hypothetical protein
MPKINTLPREHAITAVKRFYEGLLPLSDLDSQDWTRLLFTMRALPQDVDELSLSRWLHLSGLLTWHVATGVETWNALEPVSTFLERSSALHLGALEAAAWHSEIGYPSVPVARAILQLQQ